MKRLSRVANQFFISQIDQTTAQDLAPVIHQILVTAIVMSQILKIICKIDPTLEISENNWKGKYPKDPGHNESRLHLGITRRRDRCAENSAASYRSQKRLLNSGALTIQDSLTPSVKCLLCSSSLIQAGQGWDAVIENVRAMRAKITKFAGRSNFRVGAQYLLQYNVVPDRGIPKIKIGLRSAEPSEHNRLLLFRL